MDQLPRLGKRELVYCNYVASVRRGFLFLCVLGMGFVILLWHSLSLPYEFFETKIFPNQTAIKVLFLLETNKFGLVIVKRVRVNIFFSHVRIEPLLPGYLPVLYRA